MKVDLLDLTQPVNLKADRLKKEPLKLILFKQGLLLDMLTDFVEALPNESIVWLSGTVKNGVGIVEKYWKCELEYSSPGSAKTKSEWLILFLEKLRNFYPEHNLIIEAHNHPIGYALSPVDKDGLFAINDWNKELYWVMIACDFRLGSYTVQGNNINKIPWGIEGKWKENKSLKTQINSTTSVYCWVKKKLGRLRKLLLP
jgi:hypothetical protein